MEIEIDFNLLLRKPQYLKTIKSHEFKSQPK
jgi:hypothetical protein